MKTLLPLNLIVCLFLFGGWSDKKTSSYLQWDSSRKLTWGDFKGTVSAHSHADAATTIHISAKPYLKNKKLYYSVDAYFIPDQSWSKKRSAALLRHEQLHFDIAELYARKVRKKITEYGQMGIRDVNEYNNAISKILEESNRVDAEYDYSTLHGTLKSRQEKWEREIALELDVLKRFSKASWK